LPLVLQFCSISNRRLGRLGGGGIVTLPHVSLGQYLAWFRKASRPSLACRLLNRFRKIAWKLRDCYGGAVAVRISISKLRAQIKRIGLPHEAMPPRKRSGSLAGRRRGPGKSPQLSLEPKGNAAPPQGANQKPLGTSDESKHFKIRQPSRSVGVPPTS